MTGANIPTPSLGGGPLGRKVFEPAPAPATETPPPPPPPQQPAAMRPQFEVEYEKDVRSAHKRGLAAFGEDYLTHRAVIADLDKALAKRNQAEDAEFPRRRELREKSDAAIKERIDAALSYQAKAKAQGANLRRNRDDYYLEACAGWITTYRAANGKAAVPSNPEWREFDRTQGVQALIKGHIPDAVAPALNRLSGVAVRQVEALEAQAKAGRKFDLVIAEYGDDMLKKVEADKLKVKNDNFAAARATTAEGLKSTAQRRKGPRA